MEKKLTNGEINKILQVLQDKNCFLNDMSVKLPMSLRHAIRVNMDVLKERNAIFEQERQEIGNRMINEEKTYEENGSVKVKPEYMSEYIGAMNDLVQTYNSLQIEPIDLMSIGDVDMSIPEEDALMYFSPDDLEHVEGEVVS